MLSPPPPKIKNKNFENLCVLQDLGKKQAFNHALVCPFNRRTVCVIQPSVGSPCQSNEFRHQPVPPLLCAILCPSAPVFVESQTYRSALTLIMEQDFIRSF
jgi:hypothetical protein